MAAQIDLETKRKLHEMEIQVGNNKEGVSLLTIAIRYLYIQQ